MHPSRRDLVGLALATPLLLRPLQALAQAGLPTDRWAPQSLLRYWRGPSPSPGSAPSEVAPGWYSRTAALNLHRPRSGPPIPAAEAALMKRRLDLAFDALMALPPLREICGTSLDAAVNIATVGTADGVRLVHAVLSINAKTIAIDDPKTIQREGRYLTPWQEGAVLRVYLNPYEFVAARDVHAEAMTGRIVHLRTGAAYGMLVSDTVPSMPWRAYSEAARLQHDRSWYAAGETGAHPLLVHASSYAQENDLLRAGRLKPTASYARLVAAMFMVDWADLHRRMVATG